MNGGVIRVLATAMNNTAAKNDCSITPSPSPIWATTMPASAARHHAHPDLLHLAPRHPPSTQTAANEFGHDRDYGQHHGPNDHRGFPKYAQIQPHPDIDQKNRNQKLGYAARKLVHPRLSSVASANTMPAKNATMIAAKPTYSDVTDRPRYRIKPRLKKGFATCSRDIAGASRKRKQHAHYADHRRPRADMKYRLRFGLEPDVEQQKDYADLCQNVDQFRLAQPTLACSAL